MKFNKKKMYKFIIIILFIIIIFSSFNIIKWFIDSHNTKNVTKKINDIVDIVEVNDNGNTEIIEQDEIDENNPYWDYIKMNLMNVNFTDLKNINNDIVAWINVSGTNINYPIVQTNDNSFYLNHSIDKSYNDAGWVFMDYRNNINDFNRNTIFYAHGRLDNTMFGSLKNITKSDWYNDINNHIVRVSTEYENSLWQVFSIYTIPVTSDYIKTEFDNDSLYLEWLNMLKDRSYYQFNASLTSNDKIITLSTCLDDNKRVVLHAKMIKRNTKS